MSGLTSGPSRRGVLQAGVGGLALAGGLSQVRAAGEEPRRGGILSFSIAAEPPTYDLHASQTFAVMQRIAPHYSTLLRYKSGAYPEFTGDLAAEWSSSQDQLTHTFKLHPGVKFHDGSDLTSEDVRASYEHIRSPAPGVQSSRQGSLDKVDTIETPDPLTVVFRMKEVDASFIDAVAGSPWNIIYSAAKLKQDPNWPARNVMGSGPFRFVEHVAGSHWVGERFDGYFRKGLPYLDGFRAITMTMPATLAAMEGKQVLAEFRGFSPAERDRLARGLGKDARVQEATWLVNFDISVNPQKKPYDDPRVRLALSLAVDRWGAAKSLGRISQVANVGGCMMPGGLWSRSDDELATQPGYGRDAAAAKAEARRLLKEAGVENLKVKLVNRNIPPFTNCGVYVMDQWRQIGVQSDHQPLETSAWYNAIGSGSFDAVVDSYTDYIDDPTTTLVKFLSADKWPMSSCKFEDKELDDLYAQQARSTNKAERTALVRRFETRALEQAYSVPVLWGQRIVVTNERLRGWTMSPTHMIYQDLSDLWIAPA